MEDIEKDTINVCIKSFHIDNNSYLIEIDVAIQINDLFIDINGINVTKNEFYYDIELPNLTNSGGIKQPSIRFYEYAIWSGIVERIRKEIETIPWIQSFFSNEEIVN